MEHMMLLIIIADLNFRAQAEASRICREKSVDNLQKRGFSCTVAADQCNTLPALDLKGNIPE